MRCAWPCRVDTSRQTDCWKKLRRFSPLSSLGSVQKFGLVKSPPRQSGGSYGKALCPPDAVWELIANLVYLEQKMGRPRSDDRLLLNGILRVLCSGAVWRDLPERFGLWSAVYQCFFDWRDDGTLDQVLERLHIRLNQEGLIDLDT